MWALRERTLPSLFHELLATEEAEERQVPIPQIELDPRGVWRVCARPLGKVDHPRLSPLEVYAPAAPGRSHRSFVRYPGWSYLSCHERSLLAAGKLDPTNFAFTEFYEVQLGLDTGVPKYAVWVIHSLPHGSMILTQLVVGRCTRPWEGSSSGATGDPLANGDGNGPGARLQRGHGPGRNTASDDDMSGLEGRDTLNAAAGFDTLRGGRGGDTLKDD
jgi:hypothetical protein